MLRSTRADCPERTVLRPRCAPGRFRERSRASSPTHCAGRNRPHLRVVVGHEVALYAGAVVKIDPLVKRGWRVLCLAPGYIRLQQAEQAVLHDVSRPAEEVGMERERCPDAVAVDETMLRVEQPNPRLRFQQPIFASPDSGIENVDPAVNTIGAGPVRLRPAPWTVFGFDHEIIAQPGRFQVDRGRGRSNPHRR